MQLQILKRCVNKLMPRKEKLGFFFKTLSRSTEFRYDLKLLSILLLGILEKTGTTRGHGQTDTKDEQLRRAVMEKIC